MLSATIYQDEVFFLKLEAAPEQYSISRGGLRMPIARLQLEGGVLSVVHIPENATLMEQHFSDEPGKARFRDQEERDFWLDVVAQTILNLAGETP